MASAAAKTASRRVRFGDVVRQVKDKVDPATAGLDRYVAGEHMDTDSLRLRRWGDINGNYLGPAFYMRFKPGHVLYGSRRTYLRKVAVTDFSGICANTTFVLEPKEPAELLPEFLPFLMQTEAFHAHSIKQSKGSVNPYVNFSDLAWWELVLPPLEEQRELVRLLAAAAGVEMANTCLLEAGDAAFHAHTHNLLAQAAVEDALELPLAALCSRIRVGIASSVSHAYRPSGVPIIRNTDIKAGQINIAGLLHVDPAFDEVHRTKRVRSGDVVITRTATDVPGEAAVVPKELDGAQTFTTLICTPDPERLHSGFLCHWINGVPGRSFIASRKGGSGQKNLNATLLAQLPIRAPSLEEQRTIVCALNSLQDAARLLRGRRQDAAALVRSMREVLLGGRVV